MLQGVGFRVWGCRVMGSKLSGCRVIGSELQSLEIGGFPSLGGMRPKIGRSSES